MLGSNFYVYIQSDKVKNQSKRVLYNNRKYRHSGNMTSHFCTDEIRRLIAVYSSNNNTIMPQQSAAHISLRTGNRGKHLPP